MCKSEFTTPSNILVAQNHTKLQFYKLFIDAIGEIYNEIQHSRAAERISVTVKLNISYSHADSHENIEIFAKIIQINTILHIEQVHIYELRLLGVGMHLNRSCHQPYSQIQV